MTRFIIGTAAIVAALSIIGSATASSTARDPRVPALQHQVAVLTQAVLHEADLGTCRWTYQSHFNYAVINIFSALLGEQEVADATPSDQGACSRVGLNPPSRYTAAVQRSPFNTLVGLLAASSAL